MDNHILVIYGKHKRKCPKLQCMSRSVGIPRRGLSTSSFLLIGRESFCALCAHAASGSDVSLRNYLCYKTEGVKLMKCLLNIQRSSGGSHNDGVMWLRFKDETQAAASAAESERFHARWMYVCGGPSQKSHTSCQTRPRTMEQHYAGMYRLVPSGFLASDREPVRRRRLRLLSDFLGLSLRAVPDVCGRYPSGVMAHMKIQWLHTHTHTHGQIWWQCQINPSFQTAGVALCCHLWTPRQKKMAGKVKGKPWEAKSKHMECLLYAASACRSAALRDLTGRHRASTVWVVRRSCGGSAGCWSNNRPSAMCPPPPTLRPRSQPEWGKPRVCVTPLQSSLCEDGQQKQSKREVGCVWMLLWDSEAYWERSPPLSVLVLLLNKTSDKTISYVSRHINPAPFISQYLPWTKDNTPSLQYIVVSTFSSAQSQKICIILSCYTAGCWVLELEVRITTVCSIDLSGCFALNNDGVNDSVIYRKKISLMRHNCVKQKEILRLA